jgi:hypothetical protein
MTSNPRISTGETLEKWLKWAIGRHYRSLGYKVSMKPARAGNAMVDGMAVGTDRERIAIEVSLHMTTLFAESGSAMRLCVAGTVGQFLLRLCGLRKGCGRGWFSVEVSSSSAWTRRLEFTDTDGLDF